jgi:DNA-binding MltR family transcriptional regulator
MGDFEEREKFDGCNGSEEIPKYYPYDRLSSMLAELEKESDRGVALIGAAYLDEVLEQLLRAVLVDRKKHVDDLLGCERPLASFSARISMAYCLGLLDQDFYDDLQLIRKIRNDFAHRHEPASFELPTVRDRCLQLRSIKRLPPLPPASGWTPSPRNRFSLAINLLSINLESIAKDASRFEVPPEPVTSVGWDQMPDYSCGGKERPP